MASEAPPPNYKAIMPIFAADEKQDMGVVRVSVGIPGLEVCRKWKTKGFIPSYTKEEDNAVINISYEDKAFTLTVDGKDKLAGKQWALRVRQLHHPIIPEKCRHEVKNGRILLYLAKQEPKTWYPELADGLDAFDEDEENRKKEKQERKDRKKKKKKKGKNGEDVKGKGKGDGGEEDEEEEEEEDEEESEDEDDDSDEDEEEGGEEKNDTAAIVKTGKIIVYLHKLTSESWYPELTEGLDAYDELEEERLREEEEKKAKEAEEEQKEDPVPSAPPPAYPGDEGTGTTITVQHTLVEN